MVTQTFTLPEYIKWTKKFDKEMSKLGVDVGTILARALQKNINLTAPRGSTGSLRTTKIEKSPSIGEVYLTGAPHWFYVDAGMAPDKMIPIELFEIHMGNPGITAGKSVWIDNPKAFVMADYHEGQGYVQRAIDKLRVNSPKIIEKEIVRVLSK